MSERLYPDAKVTADKVILDNVEIPNQWIRGCRPVLITEDGHFRRLMLEVWVNYLEVTPDADIEARHE